MRTIGNLQNKTMFRLSVSLLAFNLVSCASAPTEGINFGCEIGDQSVEAYKNSSPSEQENLAETYLARYDHTLKDTKAALEKLFTSKPVPDFGVDARRKTVDSFREKIVRPGKDYTCFSQITDVAGTRIVIPDYAALPYVTNAIETSGFSIIENQNLLQDKGGTGYRAIHYVVNVRRRPAEIQIVTYRGKLWATASHKLVYKGPYRDNDIVKGYLSELSEAIYQLDSGFEVPVPPVPPRLPMDADDVRKLEQCVQAISDLPELHSPCFGEVARKVDQTKKATPPKVVRDELGADFFALDEFGDLAFSIQVTRAEAEFIETDSAIH